MMSNARLFRFSNDTRPPTATVTANGMNVLLDPITIAAVEGGPCGGKITGGGEGGVGVDGVPPLQPIAAMAARPARIEARSAVTINFGASFRWRSTRPHFSRTYEKY